jgi:Putative adhesin
MATPTQVPVVRRRRSLFGPVVLIGVGVVMLMITMGRLDAKQAAFLFAQYWPLIFIFWGLVKLVEHMQARHEGYAAPGIGGGGIVLLIFLLLIGTASSGIYRSTRNMDWGRMRDQMDIPDDEFGNIFGTKFEYSNNVDQDFPANASLKVISDRGTIRISPSTDGKLHVIAKKSIYANSQDEANKINSAFSPKINTVDNILTLDFSRQGFKNGGSIDLEILAPKKAPLDLTTQRGKIEVNGRNGEVKANNSHGDVSLDDVTGNANVHLRGGSFTARHINGDVTMEGHVDDTKASDITGLLNLQGEFMGEIQLSNVSKGFRFKSSRTDMEAVRLDGSLNMSGSDLRANAIGGPFRITTRSKDIHLEDVSGDVKVENTNGEVELRPKAPMGNIDIRDRKGDIRLTLPANGNFQVDANSVRGELSSDFTLTTENKNGNVRGTGTVNKGGTKVELNNEHGNISIRKQ